MALDRQQLVALVVDLEGGVVDLEVLVEFVLKRTAGSLAVGGLGYERPIVRYSPRVACEISSSIVRR